jgi:hypothetical protein
MWVRAAAAAAAFAAFAALAARRPLFPPSLPPPPPPPPPPPLPLRLLLFVSSLLIVFATLPLEVGAFIAAGNAAHTRDARSKTPPAGATALARRYSMVTNSQAAQPSPLSPS